MGNQIIRVSKTKTHKEGNIRFYYEFVAYSGRRETTVEFRGIDTKVDHTAYGLTVNRVTVFQGEEHRQSFDLGFITARNNELNHLLSILSKSQLTVHDELMRHIKARISLWEESLDYMALVKLRREYYSKRRKELADLDSWRRKEVK